MEIIQCLLGMFKLIHVHLFLLNFIKALIMRFSSCYLNFFLFRSYTQAGDISIEGEKSLIKMLSSNNNNIN